MNSTTYSLWDIILKALTLVGTLVAAAWAVHTYADTKEKEFYTAFWNNKLALFVETSSVASTMATTTSIDEFNKAREKYWELFYGRLSLVEGKSVKAAMESFAGEVPSSLIEQGMLPLQSLQQPAYRLTLALKEELGVAWRTPFGEL
jgi:hypothetical protein